MEIDSNFVGTTLKPYTMKVTWRQTTNYAAALNDSNPIYFDDTCKDGIFAHPLFPVAITWPIISNLGEFIENSEFPVNVLSTMVHYFEEVQIERLIKPRDKLTITGRIIAIQPHGKGTFLLGKLEAKDKKEKLVFTEFSGVILRGVKCIGEGKTMENYPSALNSIQRSGENGITPMVSIPVPISPLQSYIYDGCTNIEFPIHTSPKFAQSVKLPGIIVQGTAVLGIIISTLIKNDCGNDPHKIKSISAKFKNFVLPGELLTLEVLKKENDVASTRIFFKVSNKDSKIVIKSGELRYKS